MTKLFDHAVEAVSALPPDQQDLAGKILLALAGRSEPEYELTPEQLEDVRASLEEMERGEFATDEEVEAAWRQFRR